MQEKEEEKVPVEPELSPYEPYPESQGDKLSLNASKEIKMESSAQKEEQKQQQGILESVFNLSDSLLKLAHDFKIPKKQSSKVSEPKDQNSTLRSMASAF